MRVELNITLACNQACPGCNRLCDRYRTRTEHMLPNQVAAFIQDAKNAGGIDRVKVVGGEPLLNPWLRTIYKQLVQALDDGAIRKVVVETNGKLSAIDTLAPKDGRGAYSDRSDIRWLSRPMARKIHIPYLWSPMDLIGQPGVPCSAPRRCGMSLDSYGYLPCSAAIAIVRAFGLWDVYRRELPVEPWALDVLCRHCAHGLPAELRKRLACPAPELGRRGWGEPTKSWAEALERWDGTVPLPLFS